MKVHLFASENLYTYAFLSFLEKNFDISSSLFVFRRKIGFSFDYSDAVKNRIIFAESNLDFYRKVVPILKKSEKFYFHQLPYGPSLLLWYFFRGLLAKSTWIIWGGDVYIYRQGNESLKNKLYEYLRKSMIPRIPVVASFIPGDFAVVQKIYNSKAKYLHSAYPIPVSFMHKEIPSDEKLAKKGRLILVGNSGNESNNHIEALNEISFLKNSDVKIISPLSYSGNKDYINSVSVKGSEIFGDKFEPLLSMLSTDEYLDLLLHIDIAIMNHERQQGLGNILPLLYFGKKVYLKKETTTWSFLKELGCIIFDIGSLKNGYETFLEIDREELLKNREIISTLLSEERYISLWKQILA